MRKERGEELGPEWAMRVERAKELVEYGGYPPHLEPREKVRGEGRGEMQKQSACKRGEGV